MWKIRTSRRTIQFRWNGWLLAGWLAPMSVVGVAQPSMQSLPETAGSVEVTVSADTLTQSSVSSVDGLRRAMEAYAYDRVIDWVGPEADDSLKLAFQVPALKAMNRYPEAIRVLQQVLDRDSVSVKAWVDWADCHRALGQPVQAARGYRKALELAPDNRYFRLQFIRSLLSAEDYEQARTACHDWLERDSVSATGYKYLGQAYEGVQDVMHAFLSYNLAYRRDSLDGQVVARIANLFNNNEQYADAVEVTERYRLTDTTHLDVNRQCAKAYCLKKDYAEAVQRYEQLRRQGDRSFPTFYYLGISHFGDNWFYGAYDNLKEAYAQHPNDVNVLYYLGKAAARTSWKQEAVGYLQEALDLTLPKDSTLVRLYEGLAEGYQYAGETDSWMEICQKLYQLTKHRKWLHTLARTYDWQKDYANALYYYRKYMEQVPPAQRLPLDEEGNLIPDATTLYQEVEKRVKKLQAEEFFRVGQPEGESPLQLRQMQMKE